MIWIWVTIAFVISYRISDSKNNKWYHYLWMLLPIENIGISFAGAIIKPYIIFGLFIVTRTYFRRKTIFAEKKLLILVALITLTDIINGLILASIMQHILFVIVTFICFSYCLVFTADDNNIDQISDICISTVVGFGIVYCVAYVLFSLHVSISGIVSTDRFSPSIILGYIQNGGWYFYRLRGFTIDPNSVMTAFIPGFCFALFDLFGISKKKNLKHSLKNIFAIGLYIAIALMTKSRMAQLCSVVIIILILCVSIREKRISILALAVTLLVIISMIGIIIVSDTNILSRYVMDVYTQRSGVNDEAGRFSIWIRNIQTLFSMNKQWFGVGQNQIQYYTYRNKPCHNTWLEWICGVGLFIGSAMCVWEISPPFRALRKRWKYPDYIRKIMPLIISHIAICFMLTAVDHISNPNLVISTVFLHFVTDRIHKCSNSSLTGQ